MANTKSFQYYAVIEEAPRGDEQKFEIIGDPKSENSESNYIEWRQCLLSFGNYNRNGRKWVANHFRQTLMHPWFRQQLYEKGGVPGEAGHPIIQTQGAKLSMERLLTIDPDNMCLVLKSIEWDGENACYGVLQTLDDGNGPGDKFRRSILQGLIPSVSVRSIVPQAKTPDGHIDVVGPGRVICWDRVIYPSDPTAFADCSKSFEITNKKVNKLSGASESSVSIGISLDEIAGDIYNLSDNCKYVLDGLEPAMESATIDSSGLFSVGTANGHVFIPLEDSLRRDINHLMRKW